MGERTDQRTMLFWPVWGSVLDPKEVKTSPNNNICLCFSLPSTLTFKKKYFSLSLSLYLNESLVPGLGQTTEASHWSWWRPCCACDSDNLRSLKVCEINMLTFTNWGLKEGTSWLLWSSFDVFQKPMDNKYDFQISEWSVQVALTQ